MARATYDDAVVVRDGPNGPTSLLVMRHVGVEHEQTAAGWGGKSRHGLRTTPRSARQTGRPVPYVVLISWR